jgi:hypothetical protein
VGASPRSASPDLALPDNRGRQSTKGYPSSGGVVDPSHSGNLRLRLIGYSASRAETHFARVDLCQLTNRIRLAFKHPPWVSGLAQIVAGPPENAVAPASPSSALRLPHSRHRTSTGSEWSGSVLEQPRLPRLHVLRRFPLASVPVPPPFLACDPGRVASPGRIDARSRPGPSGDDRAAIPNVSGIQPGSIRVWC